MIQQVTYLLDTNAISDLMKADSRIRNWLSALHEDDRVITCTIVRGETLFGIAKLAESTRRTDLEVKARQLVNFPVCA